MTRGSTTVDREAAPAKINLALAVTGRRPDGYHLLDTLVVHGVAADEITVETGAENPDPDGPVVELEVGGPFGAALTGEADNLVVRAARLIAAEARELGRRPTDLRLGLVKHLPVASGIGGGSSDAAATLRLLDRVWRLGFGRERLARLALPLGADLPMCVVGSPLRATGIGEHLAPVDGLPPLPIVLVNPLVAVATPSVFRALERRDNPPLVLPSFEHRSAAAIAEVIAGLRNDLEPAATAVAPVVGDVIARLTALPGCLTARMSGSGATVFGLFADPTAARAAAARIAATAPDWWVTAGETLPSRKDAPFAG